MPLNQLPIPLFLQDNPDLTKITIAAQNTKNWQRGFAPTQYPVRAAITKIEKLFNEWSRFTDPFELQIEYGFIKWYLFKNMTGHYYIQLKNSQPIAGFTAPQHRWGLKMSKDVRPIMTGAFFRIYGADTLPQSHCLHLHNVTEILKTILYGNQNKKEKNQFQRQITFSSQYWEETAHCVGNLTGLKPTSPKWEQAIGYIHNPEYEKWIVQ